MLDFGRKQKDAECKVTITSIKSLAWLMPTRTIWRLYKGTAKLCFHLTVSKQHEQHGGQIYGQLEVPTCSCLHYHDCPRLYITAPSHIIERCFQLSVPISLFPHPLILTSKPITFCVPLYFRRQLNGRKCTQNNNQPPCYERCPRGNPPLHVSLDSCLSTVSTRHVSNNDAALNNIKRAQVKGQYYVIESNKY